jgi:hypothetical protein
MEEDKTKLILEASYQPQRQAEETLAKQGYKYDTELSTMENKVFYDPETNKPYVAYRGSVRATDWLGNAKLALGLKDENAERRIQLAGKVKEKYGQAPDTYGHSRGGYLSEQAGERYGGKSVTYNKAALPSDVFKTIRPEQTDIRTTSDIVSGLSVLQSGRKKKTISTKSDYKPFISNFFKTDSLLSGAVEAHNIKHL